MYYECERMFWSEDLKGRKHLADLRAEKRMILKLILKKYGECRLDASSLG
jgi:hypothetical protein